MDRLPRSPNSYISVVGEKRRKKKKKKTDLLRGGKNSLGKFHFSMDCHKKLKVWPRGF